MTRYDDVLTVGHYPRGPRAGLVGLFGGGIAVGVAVLVGAGGIALAVVAVLGWPVAGAVVAVIAGLAAVLGACAVAVPVVVQVLDQVDGYRFDRDRRHLAILALEGDDGDDGDAGRPDLWPIVTVKRNGAAVPLPGLPAADHDDQNDQDAALDLLCYFVSGVPALGLGRRGWVPQYLSKAQYSYCCDALESVALLRGRGPRSSGDLVADAPEIVKVLRAGWDQVSGKWGDVPALPSGLASGLVWSGSVGAENAGTGGVPGGDET